MNLGFSGCEPILCAHLLRKIDGQLIHMLGDLRSEEWELPTIVPHWQVRDVAAHLLDTPLRKLSLVRDRWFAEKNAPRSSDELAGLVNRLNDEGVRVYRRLSPSLLIGLMQTVCEQSACFHESLDPFAHAFFPVSWAGEEQSPNWFDTARELTERWHHHQQIRLACHRPGIETYETYHPVLDCFARGLPHVLRNLDAPVGAGVLLEITGECGGRWALVRACNRWNFSREGLKQYACTVHLPQSIAWRVFTRGIDLAETMRLAEIEGDPRLASAILGMTAIVG